MTALSDELPAEALLYDPRQKKLDLVKREGDAYVKAETTTGLDCPAYDGEDCSLTSTRCAGSHRKHPRAKLTVLLPGRNLLPELDELAGDRLPGRPRTRAECADAPRPCPFVGCRHHLYLDELKGGGLRFNFPELSGPEEMDPERSCVLDIAESGPRTLVETAEDMNVCREWVRQIEVSASRHFRKTTDLSGVDEEIDQDWEELNETPYPDT